MIDDRPAHVLLDIGALVCRPIWPEHVRLDIGTLVVGPPGGSCLFSFGFLLLSVGDLALVVSVGL